MPAGLHPTSCNIEFPDALSTLPFQEGGNAVF